MMKSSNISLKKVPDSSNGMHASPAVGARCVRSSGSSLSTKRAEERESERKRKRKYIRCGLGMLKQRLVWLLANKDFPFISTN